MENLPRGRRSRRSSSNLNLSNISPLTTHFSLTNIESAFDNNNAFDGPRYSYIQGASAPTTPSVLSRATSRKRPIRKNPTLSVPGTPRHDLSDLQKSKSASHLLIERRTSYFEYPSGIPHHNRRPTHRRNESTEWVHRAGIALTSETRESKGQSWLASRASSTSVLDNNDSSDEESSAFKRIPSRRASQPDFLARQKSRSRTKLLQEQKEFLHLDIPHDGRVSTHPLAPEFIDEAFMGSAFDDEDIHLHGQDSEIDEDDEEELHWSKRPRAGLGAWVDSMVGWSLFSVDEEFNSDDDDEQEKIVIVKSQAPPHLTLPREAGDEQTAGQEQQLQDVSVWSDVGWVLSMGAKALF